MSRPLRIGIDARAAVEEPAGRGQVVRELVAALGRRDDDDRYLLYLREPWEIALDARFERVPITSPDPLWHLRATRHANRHADVFLATSSYLSAWFARIPSVLVVYDLIAFMPEAHPQRRAALIERATIRPALRRARRLLAISDWTRRDLVARHPHVVPRVRVVPLAAGSAFRSTPAPAAIAAARARHGLEEPFALSVGTIEPRKNIARLVRAWASLPDAVRGGRVLALAGRAGWEMEQILDEVDAHRTAVRLLGYVPEDDLVALYHACDVFCYPSLYEGFGLPVHEALCCGAPVLTSRVSSLPEVAGDAALLVDPTSQDDIARGLRALLTDEPLRARLRAASGAQAARFDWDRTAAAFVAALREAAGVGPTAA